MEELKACPFCGGKAVMIRRWHPEYGTRKHIWIKCKDCGVTTINYGTDDDAVTAWNRRDEPENKAQ